MSSIVSMGRLLLSWQFAAGVCAGVGFDLSSSVERVPDGDDGDAYCHDDEYPEWCASFLFEAHLCGHGFVEPVESCVADVRLGLECRCRSCEGEFALLPCVFLRLKLLL